MSQIVPFLRRRTPAQTRLPGSLSSLSISAPPDGPPPDLVAPARGVMWVDRRRPMVVLNSFQSAIGSLAIIPEAGAQGVDVAWELSDGRCGTLQGIPTDLGRRPLVSWEPETGFVLGLRHVQGIRRAIFYLPTPQLVTAQLFDGTVITFQRDVRALAMYRLDGQIYLRHDAEDYPDIAHVQSAYGMSN